MALGWIAVIVLALMGNPGYALILVMLLLLCT